MPKREGSDSSKLNVRMLEQLACPVCFGNLRLGVDDSSVDCLGCGRVYPLIDGIPILIAERAAKH